MKKNKLLIFIVLTYLFNLNAVSQPTLDNNKLNHINGKVWIPKDNIKIYNSFFQENLSLNGSLFMSNSWVHNENFGFDLDNHNVIKNISSQDNTKRYIVLNKEELSDFTITNPIGSYHFKRGDLLHQDLNPNHYYQVIKSANKNILFLIEWNLEKKLSTAENVNFKIVADNKIYAVTSSNLHEISSKKDVYDAFQISKKEIALHFRKNNIKFRKDSTIDIVSTLQYFIH